MNCGIAERVCLEGPKKKKPRKPVKYVIAEGICLEGSKKSKSQLKVLNHQASYSRKSFIRVCRELLPGPATTVRYIRRYVIPERTLYLKVRF